jgi:F-type H+-transporting ATPase subunit a
MRRIIKNTVLALILAVISVFSYASDGHEEKHKSTEPFNPSNMIMHHIGDSHDWHFATIDETHISIPLPVILITNQGLEVFMSSKFHHGHETYNGFKLTEDDKIESVDPSKQIVLDISITKNVASLLISTALLLGIFLTIASRYKNNRGVAPRGIQSFFEPIIIYIRDDVAKSAIGPKYSRYMPDLLTVFFFIWFNNLLGLMPGGANLTGNIAVTLVLAVITFVITQVSGNKTYWGHILWTPGVPLPLRIIILPIEILGIVTKPFSLMIRLFANITAGHILILSLISLAFLFESYAVGIASSLFATFMMLLELFVALLQAYIFTLLSAMYFGSAVEEHHEAGELPHDHGH